jgi:membrane protein YdbS with pleckstrin-like domain
MSDKESRLQSSVASAAIFFLLVVFFQLVFELIFGDPIDARFLLQAVLASAIITALNVIFEQWRFRRRP